MRILIAGFLHVAPEKRDQILNDIAPFNEASRNEPGCERYDWSPDFQDPGKIHVFEAFDDEESLAKHFASDSYWKTRGIFDEIGVIESEIYKYQSNLRGPVYDDEGMPRADFFATS